jgi:hypothetical protein
MRRGSFPRKKSLAFAVAAAIASTAAGAVSLNPDGLGQALIYPYYTVRSAGGNAFHTYLTVGNSTADSKALRVRFREGRNGREVLAFNLYLGANDLWAGAVVPTAEGTQLLTNDTSCTDPAFANGTIALRRDLFTGASADGMGDTLDRTREGFVEILEMATLTGDSAAAIRHNAAGVPANCAAIRASPQPSVAAPTGGIWGTLTLINVNGGQDFTLDATALADLASRPYFRPPSDPYPDFNAAEIDPVSNVLRRGHDPSAPPIPRFDNANFLYRSTWERPVDAVSAVLMSTAWQGEYVLDAATVSATDFVVTMPTRHYYAAQGPRPPFSGPGGWSPTCARPTPTSLPLGETVVRLSFSVEGQSSTFTLCPDTGFPTPCAEVVSTCASTAVASLLPREPFPPESAVLGSTTKALAGDWRLDSGAATSGWTVLAATSSGAVSLGLGSLATSARVNLDTGEVLAGRHTFFGLPVVGFYARTFNNGQLSCAAGTCQGTYGSAGALRYFRVILP